MTKEAQYRARLNQEMGQQREHLARLLQELEADEALLSKARDRHARLSMTLEELAAEAETKRKEVFALKLELEAKRRSKLRMKMPPGGWPLEAHADHFDHHRAFVRAPFVMPVIFGGLRNFYAGLAINVSDGGMLVATCDPPPLHRRFAVEFTLASDDLPIRAPVESVWIRQDGEPDRAGFVVSEVGLRFLALQPGDKERLAAFSNAYAEAATGFDA